MSRNLSITASAIIGFIVVVNAVLLYAILVDNTELPDNHVEHVSAAEISRANSARFLEAKRVEAAQRADRARRVALEEKRKKAHDEAVKKAAQKKTEKKTEKKAAAKAEKKAPQKSIGGIQARIRWCESRNDYNAQNKNSSASGAYQFLDGTWRSVTGLSGSAKDYSPAVQDEAFRKLYAKSGTSPWNASKGCWS